MEASIHFLNVGQGDCAVVQFPEGEIMLIDCHHRAGCAPPAIDLLDQIAIKRNNNYDIDVLCLTHPDVDHYQGMLEVVTHAENHGGKIKNLILFEPASFKDLSVVASRVLNELREVPEPPDALVSPEFARLTQKYSEFRLLSEKLGQIAKQIRTEGRCYERAKGFFHFKSLSDSKIYVLGPPTGVIDRHREGVWEAVIRAWATGEMSDNDSANEISCLILLIIGSKQILLTGDTTAEVLQDSLISYSNNHRAEHRFEIRCNVVKAAHHGARSGSSDELWNNLLAHEDIFVVFSAGAHHKFKHPHSETLGQIRNVRPSARFYCTNVCDTLRRKLTEGIIPLGIIDVLEDDSEALPGPLINTSYHGTCTFRIGDDNILPQPEFSPSHHCDYH